MRRLRFVVSTLCSAVLAFAPAAVLAAGPANADCTGAGDFGAGSGCPPPGDSDGSGGPAGEAWPPTAVDWPPSQSSSASEGAGGGKSTPIVLPDGQTAPSRPSHSADSSSAAPSTTSTSTPPTPIVPAGAPSTASPSTVIVAPAAAH